MRSHDGDRHTTAVPVMATAVFFCLTCLMLPFPASAAWTREQGAWFTAQSFSSYRTNRFITVDDRRIAQPTFIKREWNSYAEYGWRDDTTLGFNLFLHRLESDRGQYNPILSRMEIIRDDNYGLADSEVFIRQKLWQGTVFGHDARLAVQPLLKLPSLYLEGGPPRSGTDTFDGELRLQGGMTFPLLARHHFAAMDIAYRKRGGNWRDQIKADTTLGLQLSDDFMFLSQLHVTKRAQGTSHAANTSDTVNDYDLWKAQLSLVYRLNATTRLQMGGFRHIHARNTGDGDGIVFSIWREF